MSVDKYAYFGAYLKAGKINVKHQEAAIGCPVCNTDDSQSKFCSKCGGHIDDYSKDATARSVADLLVLAEDQGHLVCYDDLFDKFMIDGEIVNCHSEERVGFEVEVTYDFKELSMPEVDQKKAVDFYQEITQVLDTYQVPYELKIGIMFSCR